MKKILFVFLILILFVFVFYWYNNNPKIIISSLAKNNKIHSGELRYLINFLGFIPAGEANLAVPKREKYKGADVYHLTAETANLKIYHWIRRVSAAADSYVDIRTLNPALFAMKFSISGKEDTRKEVIYDQKNNIMSIANIERQILPNTQDPLSMILNLEKIDFELVKEIEMNINTNQKNYILKGKVRGEDLTIHNKKYRIFILEANISRREKNPYHKTSLRVVFLKDKENIPILMKVFASGVLVSAKLTDIK